MHTLWPQPKTVSLPELHAEAVTIRAGIVADHSRWSSTAVSGSVSGSVYNGNGGVSGSISSTVTDHQRIFIHFPDDGTEMALRCDDWNLDVRAGHCLVVAFGGRMPTRADDTVVVLNAHTRVVAPGDDLNAGRLARRFASTSTIGLWFWRLVALGLAFMSGLLVLAWLDARGEDDPSLPAIIVGGVVLFTVGRWISRTAKNAMLRRLGREVRAAVSPALEQVAAEIPRPAPAMASA